MNPLNDNFCVKAINFPYWGHAPTPLACPSPGLRHCVHVSLKVFHKAKLSLKITFSLVFANCGQVWTYVDFTSSHGHYLWHDWHFVYTQSFIWHIYWHVIFGKQDYSINIYLRQVWEDPRLQYSGFNKTLTLSYKQFENIWVPDIYVINEKEGRFHDITVPNRLLQVTPNGKVLYSQR